MDPELVAQSLNFHGQQLTKALENEKGSTFLQGVAQRDLDYQVFQKRSKELGFQDRGKRNRLHQFIAENASTVFKIEKKPRETHSSKLTEDLLPILPPLESFCNFDKDETRSNFFQTIKHGDVLIVQIQQKQFHGLTFRLIATDDCTRTRDVRELGIKGSIHPDHSVAIADRKDGSYNTGDLVRCEVIDVSPESEKLVCGLKGVNQPAERMDIKFGLISKDQLPKNYRIMMEHDGKSYEECLQSTRTFYNPSATEHLAQSFGLDLTSSSYSMLKAFSTPIDDKEMADALRKTQSNKWSRHSTTEGIKYFRSGMETEAFQCFNKALHIDPVNVEALVARGALYANKGSYEKAIADFEVALKENPTHANAVNYASETLVAYAKQLEEEKNIDTAIQQYQKCLVINPSHNEARTSLQQLSKGRGRPSFNLDFLDVENGKKDHDAEEKEEGRKSRRRKKKKRGSSSSSSRSSNSSSSRFSSPDSGSSRGRRKSRKSKKDKREQSLSPFSKKMAQLNPPMAGSAPEAVPAPSLYPSTEYPSVSTQPHPVPPPSFGVLSSGNPPAPAFAGYSAPVPAPDAFLGRPAANDDYEKKVEMFLQRVGKGGEEEKEKEKDKKKKKKKEKSKDKKKKDGKREKGKEKKHKKKKKGSDDEDSDITFPNPTGLDELGELEAKLSAVYNKLTAKKKKKKKKRHSSGSSDSSSSSGSSSDSELERKKRKAKKAFEDLAAAAALLRATENKAKLEPVPPPAYVPTPGAGAAEEAGKWRSMPLKVNLGRASDEPEVEESRMVYLREDHKGMQQQQQAMEQDDELPPGEDRVSFQFKPFGVFGPGGRPLAKPVSPPKGMDDQPQEEGNQEKGGRSRSGSRRRSRSRSRSRSRRSRTRSRSRSRGRSYSRSRSRSRSGERRYHTNRYRGGNRHPNQNYHHRGGRYPQRGGYNNRGRGWINYNNRGGYNNRPYHNRPYNNNNNQGYDNRRHRGRNRGGYWQQQMRSRSRSRTRSRSRSRSRSYSRSGSRSPSRSRSRSRHDNRRNRDASPRDERRNADQKPEEKVAPVPAPTGVPPPSLGRKMGGKWNDGGGDDDEDLVPPGCE